jgi:hypothetical protein
MWPLDMFCNFHVEKIANANNLTFTEVIEKISTDLESLKFIYCVISVCLYLKILKKLQMPTIEWVKHPYKNVCRVSFCVCLSRSS